MRKRKLEESFTVHEALRHSLIEVEEDGRARCPFHKGKIKHLKHYPELNAVACLNPKCVHYRKVFTSVDLLSAVAAGSRADLKALAEDLLIEELEAYRATGVQPLYPKYDEKDWEETEEETSKGVDTSPRNGHPVDTRWTPESS